MSGLEFIALVVVVLILVLWCIEQLRTSAPFNKTPTLMILLEVLIVLIALVVLLSHFGYLPH